MTLPADSDLEDRAASGGNATSSLPDVLGRYFWDQDPTRLTWPDDRHAIIGRLLEVGGWDAVCWLRRNVDHETLRDHLARRRGRGLSPRRLRFWGFVLELPRDRVDEWISDSASSPWRRRGAG